MLKSEPGGTFSPTYPSYLSVKWNINPNCGSSMKGTHCWNTVYVLNVCWDLKSEFLSPQWIPKWDFFFMYLEYCHWTLYAHIVRENHIASPSLKPNTRGTEIIAFQSGCERRLQNLCSRNQLNHALILLLCRIWDHKCYLSQCKRYIQDKLERSNTSNSYGSPNNCYENLSS
jgi:hypothetical protein